MHSKSEIVYGNEKIIESFNNDEKELLFNDLMNMYFKKNFGTVSKIDIETYLFSFYIEHLLDKGFDFDDYTLGKDLGITLAKVRSLKERKELKYPRANYNWQDEFLMCAQNAKFDDRNNLIKFAIPDVNVIKDVRNFFEKNNQYDEYQLNPKLFQCRLDAFEEIGKKIAEVNGTTFEIAIKNKEELALVAEGKEKEQGAIKKIIGGAIEEGIKELLKNGSKEVILEVMKYIVPGAGIASTIYKIIKQTLEK